MSLTKSMMPGKGLLPFSDTRTDSRPPFVVLHVSGEQSSVSITPVFT